MALQRGLDMSQNLLRVQPAEKLNELKKILDGHQLWKQLVSVVKKRKFMISDTQLSQMELCVFNPHHSPSSKLFLDWGSRGMTLGDLISLLEQLQLERPLMVLKENEPLQVRVQPAPRLVINSGTALKLTCSASGFPYPKYIWFKGRVQVSVASSPNGDLTIDPASSSDTGLYTCRIHKSHNSRLEYLFTDWSTVVVNGNAQSDSGQFLDSSTKAQNDPQSALVIIEQPRTPLSLQMFTTLKLSCMASGSHKLYYQWLHNGIILDKQTSPILQISHVDLNHSGEYRCVVRDTMQQRVESNTSVVTVYAEQLLAATSANPSIVLHPLSQTEIIGADVCLSVKVSPSHYTLAYQWYHNGLPIRDETQAKLNLLVKSAEVAGDYQCRVYSLDHGQRCLGETVSDIAKLEVKAPSYTATDKVALILGVGMYKERPLPAVTNDVSCATKCFESMGFKVMSFLNLKLLEMRQALHMFRDLIDNGVYAVFYYVGHGFEYQRQKYFVPFDAPPHPCLKDCMCAEEVYKTIQMDKQPTVLLMIIDCCRTENPQIDDDHQEIYQPDTTGNTIIVCASSYGQESYEPLDKNAEDYKYLIPTTGRHQRQGIFSAYLCTILMKEQKMSIIELICKLQNEFRQNRFGNQYRQHPEVLSNMYEHGRSLRDPIVYGSTAAMNKRCYKYKISHEIPLTTYIRTNCSSNICISFHKVFSNVISMNIDWGLLCNGNVHIQDVPQVLWPVVRSFDGMGVVKQISFGNLQRLQGHLKLPMEFTFKDAGKDYLVKCTVVFGWPLVSAMNQQSDDTVAGRVMTARDEAAVPITWPRCISDHTDTSDC